MDVVVPTAIAAPQLGITCPKCGRLLDSVLFTRKAVAAILRVRKCEPCRRRWRTSETIIPGTPRARDEEPATT